MKYCNTLEMKFIIAHNTVQTSSYYNILLYSNALKQILQLIKKLINMKKKMKYCNALEMKFVIAHTAPDNDH